LVVWVKRRVKLLMETAGVRLGKEVGGLELLWLVGRAERGGIMDAVMKRITAWRVEIESHCLMLGLIVALKSTLVRSI